LILVKKPVNKFSSALTATDAALAIATFDFDQQASPLAGRLL
jgi:hypothetical protein